MINVAELLDDPDLSQTFQVERNNGHFDEGEWVVESPTVLNFSGVIQPASNEDKLEILPEGARLSNVIVVYASQEIQIDNANDHRSDVILWHGNTYRVIASRHWIDYGYWQVWAEGFIR